MKLTHRACQPGHEWCHRCSFEFVFLLCFLMFHGLIWSACGAWCLSMGSLGSSLGKIFLIVQRREFIVRCWVSVFLQTLAFDDCFRLNGSRLAGNDQGSDFIFFLCVSCVTYPCVLLFFYTLSILGPVLKRFLIFSLFLHSRLSRSNPGIFFFSPVNLPIFNFFFLLTGDFLFLFLLSSNFLFYFTWLCQTYRLARRLHSPQISFMFSFLEFAWGAWFQLISGLRSSCGYHDPITYHGSGVLLHMSLAGRYLFGSGI